MLSKEISCADTIVLSLTCVSAAGLRGEERVQKSRAADQTCSVSSKVTCCDL